MIKKLVLPFFVMFLIVLSGVGVFGNYTITDLSTTDTDNWVGSSSLRSIAVDQNSDLVYTGLTEGKFGAYNRSSGVWSKLYEFPDYSEVKDIKVNPETGMAFVITDVSGSFQYNYTNKSTLAYSAGSNAKMSIDNDRQLVYSVGGIGKFNVWNITSASSRSLGDTDTDDWINGYVTNDVDVGSNNDLVYINVNHLGYFGVYNLTSDITSLVFVPDINVKLIRFNPVYNLTFIVGNYYNDVYKIYNFSNNVTTNLSFESKYVSDAKINNLNGLMYLFNDSIIVYNYSDDSGHLLPLSSTSSYGAIDIYQTLNPFDTVVYAGGNQYLTEYKYITPTIDNPIPGIQHPYNINLNYDVNCSGATYYYDNTTLFDINFTTGRIFFSPTSEDVGNYSINITCGDDIYNVSQIFSYNITGTHIFPESTTTINATDIPDYSDVTSTVSIISYIGNLVNLIFNWFVNGALTVTDTIGITELGNYTSTFGAGNFSAGDNVSVGTTVIEYSSDNETIIYNESIQIDDDLVARYKLDSQTFSANNQTDVLDYMELNNGTLSGKTFNDGTVSGGVTISDGAMVFDGVDDYVEVAHDESQLLTTGGSISAWIKPISNGESGGRIVDKSESTSGGNGYYFAMHSTEERVRFSINGTLVAYSGANVPLGSWSLVTVTFNSTGYATMYVNGVVSGTPTQLNSPASITTTSALRIGNYALGTTRTFNGSIDDVQIYNRALTSTEITAQYNLGRGKYANTGDGLVAQYSGRDFAGTEAIPTTIYDTNHLVNGKVNEGFTFDGVDDYVIIYNDSSLTVNGNFTASAWVNPTTLSGHKLIFGDSLDWFIRLQTGNNRIVGYYTNTSGVPTGGYIGDSTVQPNQWSLVTVVYNAGNSITAYLNGEYDGVASVSGDYLDSGNHEIRIGQIGSYIFNGSIDDVRIYNRSLSENEIKVLYETGTIGLHATVNSPSVFSTPLPADDSVNQSLTLNLNITVSDVDGNPANVSFYDASDDSIIGAEQTDIASGDSAQVELSGLSYATTYTWYAKANTLFYTNQSETYSFTTITPLMTLNNPVDESTNNSLSQVINVSLSNLGGQAVNVSCYQTNGSLIGTNTSLTEGDSTYIPWVGLSYGETYDYYCNLTREGQTFKSEEWNFTTITPIMTLNNPVDESTENAFSQNINVTTTNLMGESVNVSCYQTNGSLIGTNTSLTEGDSTYILWDGLNHNTTYNFYCNLTMGTQAIQSDTWSFTTLVLNQTIITVNTPTFLNYTTLTGLIDLELNFTAENGNPSLGYTVDSCWYTLDTNVSNEIDIPSCVDYDTYNLTMENVDSGAREVTVYVKDSFGVIGSKSQEFTVNDVTFNDNVFEGSSNNFSVKIYNLAVPPSSPKINYDGTNYTMTITNQGEGTYLISKFLDAPFGENSTDFYFMWNSQKTQTYTQNIVGISIGLCSNETNLTSPVVNFYTRDSAYPRELINTSFVFTLTYGLYEGGSEKTYTFEDLTQNNSSYSFCTINESLEFYGNMITIATKEGWNDLTNYYATVNLTADIPKNYTLYLAYTNATTPTVIKIVTTAGIPLEGLGVVLQTYYPDLDAFIETGSGITSVLGDEVFYLRWYDTTYRFIFTEEDGDVALATGSLKISETPTTFILPFEITNEYDHFDGIEYSLTYDNSSQQFTLTWVDTLAQISSGCLMVTKSDLMNSEEISNQCLESHSATLYYVIDEEVTGNGTYLATFYAVGSPTSYIGQIYAVVGEIHNELQLVFKEALGEIGTTWISVIIVGTVAFAGLISPILAVVMTIAGLIIAWASGMLTLDFAAIVTVALVGGFVIWAIRK